MGEQSILFSGPMIRALVADRKTMTRRLAAPRWKAGDLVWVREAWKPHSLYTAMKPREMPRSKVFYRADDGYAPSNTRWHPSIHMPRWASRLTLEIVATRQERLQDIGEADAAAEGISYGPAQRHGDHDPRWILGRCRDCAHWDPNQAPNGGARACCPYHFSDRSDPQPSHGDSGQGCSTSFVLSDGAEECSSFQFRHFWDLINGASPEGHWGANPLVWVTSFAVHKLNIDALRALHERQLPTPSARSDGSLDRVRS